MRQGVFQLGFLTALVVSVAPVLGASKWIDSIVGDYNGTIAVYPSTKENSVTTKLWLDDKGLLSGSYSSEFQGQKYDGTLKLKKKTKKRTVTFAWKDQYGSGDLNVKFADDLASFKGEYYTDGEAEPSGSWNGAKSK